MRSTNLKEQGMGEHNFGDYIVFVDESGDQSLNQSTPITRYSYYRSASSRKRIITRM